MLRHFRMLACALAFAPGAASAERLIAEVDQNTAIFLEALLGSMIGDLAPDARRAPEYGTVNVFTGATADPLRARIKVGGFWEMGCGGGKYWFPSKPDINVNYQGEHALRVLTITDDPVALLVLRTGSDAGDIIGCNVSQQGRGAQVAVSNEFPNKGSYSVFMGSPREDYFPNAEILLTERNLSFFARDDWRDSVMDAGGLKNSPRRPVQAEAKPAQPTEPSSESGGSKPFVIGMSDGSTKDEGSGAQSNPVVIGMAGTTNATSSPTDGAQTKPFVITIGGDAPKEPEILLEPPIRGTMCTNEDWVVFSAVSDMSGKVVSICMTEGDDENPSHLTYRFGQPGDVELLYPSGAAGSFDAFMLRTYTRAQTSYLKFEFRNGGYDYAILEGYEGNEADVALRVTRLSDNKVIALQSLTMQTEPLTLMQLDQIVPVGPFDE